MDIFLSTIVEGVWVVSLSREDLCKKACLNASLVSAECFHNLLVKIVFHAFKRGENMGWAPSFSVTTKCNSISPYFILRQFSIAPFMVKACCC